MTSRADYLYELTASIEASSTQVRGLVLEAEDDHEAGMSLQLAKEELEWFVARCQANKAKREGLPALFEHKGDVA